MATIKASIVGTKAQYATIADSFARLGFWLVLINVVVSTILGLIAIVAWQDAGSGPGGGWGVPGLSLLLAAAMGIPGSLLGVVDVGRGQWRHAGRLLAAAGPFLIFLGFFFGNHLVDPCARGWVDPQSGSCEWAAGTCGTSMSVTICSTTLSSPLLHSRLCMLSSFAVGIPGATKTLHVRMTPQEEHGCHSSVLLTHRGIMGFLWAPHGELL